MTRTTIQALRRLSRKRKQAECCELCGVALPEQHNHMLERGYGQIRCACEPCAVLFSHRGAEQRYVRIPRDVRRLENFQITDAEWNALLLPIDLAFFIESSAANRVVAYYPGPAGATESALDVRQDAILRPIGNRPLLPDVEALLINRTHNHRDYYIVPIDHCYRLTGLIRKHWRGLSGGDEVWHHIESFFSDLAERATPEVERAHA